MFLCCSGEEGRASEWRRSMSVSRLLSAELEAIASLWQKHWKQEETASLAPASVWKYFHQHLQSSPSEMLNLVCLICLQKITSCGFARGCVLKGFLFLAPYNWHKSWWAYFFQMRNYKQILCWCEPVASCQSCTSDSRTAWETPPPNISPELALLEWEGGSDDPTFAPASHTRGSAVRRWEGSRGFGVVTFWAWERTLWKSFQERLCENVQPYLHYSTLSHLPRPCDRAPAVWPLRSRLESQHGHKKITSFQHNPACTILFLTIFIYSTKGLICSAFFFKWIHSHVKY